MTTELATKTEETALAEARPSQAFLDKRKAAIQAQGKDAIRIGVLHLHQGSGKEDMAYGSHPKGTYIDELSMTALEDGTRVMPIHVEAYKAVWYEYESKKGNGGPLAIFRGDQPRPTHDGDGNPIPWDDPDIFVQDHLDLFLLLPGDPTPRLYRAKSTALKAVQSMNSLEASRVAAGRMPGAYRLGTRQRSNDENQWFVPQFVADGDITQEELALFEGAFDLVTSGKFEVVEAEQAAAPGPGDGVAPI